MPGAVEKVVENVLKRCGDQARKEMQERLDKLKAYAAELCNELSVLDPLTGRPISIEDICNAASQSHGINHPKIMQLIAARADELTANFVANAIAEIADARAKAKAERALEREQAA